MFEDFSSYLIRASYFDNLLFNSANKFEFVFNWCKGEFIRNAVSRVFLNSFSVAKECRMKPNNTNLSSYNPSRTLNLGTEEKCGDGIKITSLTQVLSTRLGCLMDDGAS